MPELQAKGARLNYLREGRGPAVLLLQGVGAVAEAWRPQIAMLKHRFTCFAPDNRGIGGSEILDGRLSIEAMAEDALAIMEAEKIERFHIVGHSMGGVIAQQVALSARSRAISLGLLCTFVQGRQATRLTWDILVAGLRTRLGPRAGRRRAFLELIFPAAYLRTVEIDRLAAELATLFARDLADQPPIVMKQLRAMGGCDLSTRFTELAQVPTLVGSAAYDRIALPEFGRTLARLITGARYVEFPDAGHAAPIQQPEMINRLLAEHFSAAENPPGRALRLAE